VFDLAQHLEPEIISLGTTRGLRVRRVGVVFFVESLHLTREPGVEGVIEAWKVVAVAKGEKARAESIQWLHDANIAVQKQGAGSRRAP
jgi:hypothetical protein